MHKILKSVIVLTFGTLLATGVTASDTADEIAVKDVAMNYVLGFYYGKTKLLDEALSPELRKLGWGDTQPKDGERGGPYYMPKEAALKFAPQYAESEKFPPDTYRKVTVMEVLDKIASVKVEAVWGIDYMHLAKNNGKWQIYHVIWQGWPDGMKPD